MKIVLVAAVVLVLGSSTASATTRSCTPIRFTLSTAQPVSLTEECAGTVVVDVQINGRSSHYSQSFDRGNGLIEYGYGASVRLYQDKAMLRVRAATSAPTGQHVTIRFSK